MGRASAKETIVFQASIFRGELLVSGRVGGLVFLARGSQLFTQTISAYAVGCLVTRLLTWPMAKL